MGMLELERTFNFKGWELSYIFSYSDKVNLILLVIIYESYFMTNFIFRRYCTGNFVKNDRIFTWNHSDHINVM